MLQKQALLITIDDRHYTQNQSVKQLQIVKLTGIYFESYVKKLRIMSFSVT